MKQTLHFQAEIMFDLPTEGKKNREGVTAYNLGAPICLPETMLGFLCMLSSTR